MKKLWVFLVLFFNVGLEASVTVDTDEGEENLVVISCGGGRMMPQPSMFPNNSNNSFQTNAYSNKYIFSVDHQKLYITDKKSAKLLKSLTIGSVNEDWVFDVAYKNKFLVVFGFSAEEQANKIVRFRFDGQQLSKIDQYRIEFPAKDDYDVRSFSSPLTIHSKLVANYSSWNFKAFKIYRELEGSRELLRDLFLENQDGENYTNITLFADVFSHNMDFRSLLQNHGYNWSENDGYRSYQFLSHDDIKRFASKISNYNNYLSYTTDYHLFDELKTTPSSYLLTLDFVTERFKVRAFDKLPAENWEIDFSYQNSEQVLSNVFNAYNDNGDELHLHLNGDWSPRLIVPMENEAGGFESVEMFNTHYYYIEDYYHNYEVSERYQKLHYVKDKESELMAVELNHGINHLEAVGHSIIARGNNNNDILSLSILDKNDHTVQSEFQLDGFVDVADNDVKLLKLGVNKYLYVVWTSRKELAEKDDLSFEPLDEYGNGYELVFIAIDNGHMQLIHTESLDIYSNNHCSSYCHEDPKEFWDNRHLMVDDNKLIIRKASNIDIFEFDANFKFTRKFLDLSAPDGLKSNDL